EHLATFVQVLGFLGILGRLVERQRIDFVIADRNLEPVAEFAQRRLRHFLLLVGNVLALAGITHAIALDGLGQNHGRTAVVEVDGLVIGGVYLVWIVAAAIQ